VRQSTRQGPISQVSRRQDEQGPLCIARECVPGRQFVDNLPLGPNWGTGQHSRRLTLDVFKQGSPCAREGWNLSDAWGERQGEVILNWAEGTPMGGFRRLRTRLPYRGAAKRKGVAWASPHIAQGAGLNSLHQGVLVIVGECRGTGHSPPCAKIGGAKTPGRVSDPCVVTWRTVSTPPRQRASGRMRERQVEKSEDRKGPICHGCRFERLARC
jgi:hypothetical protein